MIIVLDNQERVKEVDKSSMLNHLVKTPDYCRDAIKRTAQTSVPAKVKPQSIVIVGMGGSAIGGGGRGGHGKAGYDKHKWTYTVKYDSNRFGKKGFKPHSRNEVNVINVGRLDEQIPYLLRNKQAKKTDKGIKIELAQFGYGKLLGKGQVTNLLIIEVGSLRNCKRKNCRSWR